MAARTFQLANGETLLHQGEASSNMYVLKEGILRVTINKRGRVVELGHIHSGEMVGEMSFLDAEPRCATVKAVSDCQLVEVPREVFEKTIQTMPKWFHTLHKTLLERLRKANKLRT